MSVADIFDISGKKALVTGSARGIGKVLALTLAEAGCDVSLVGLHLEGVESVAEEINAIGVKAVACQADVSKKDEIDRVKRFLMDERFRITLSSREGLGSITVERYMEGR